MLDGGMTLSFYALNCPVPILQNACKSITRFRRRLHLNSSVLQTDENGNLAESKKILSSGLSLSRSHTSKSLIFHPNTVGVIGGVSVVSTLLFLEKLVWWSLKDGKESIPFVVCSDPTFYPLSRSSSRHGLNDARIIENLKRKTVFLEQSGAHCIITPCHRSHEWLSNTSESCKLPFLHVGDCVARELKDSKLKPLEAGSSVRIGLLAIDATAAGLSVGLDVVLPDRETREHIVIPAMEALNKRDKEGAKNLLRIAIHVLLVRAVNMVIVASDELLSLLPPDDPLLKKCIDPMDALARAAIKWSRSTENIFEKT